MSDARRAPVRGRNLVLSGYIGPTQQAVARQVAARLGMPFVDIDTRVEASNDLTTEEIRTRFGEARLKTLEAEVLEEALLQRAAVIRVSGYRLAQGAWLRRFRETGLVLCLVSSIDAVLQALHQSLGTRYHDAEQRAVALGELQREWALRGSPDILELDTTDLELTQIVTAVTRLWERALLREEMR